MLRRLGGRRGAGFRGMTGGATTPVLDTASLNLDHDWFASEGVSLSGSNVTQWDDQVSGADLTPIGTGPVYGAAAIGGRPGITWSGSADTEIMTGTGSTHGSGSWSCAVICNPASASAAFRYFVDFGATPRLIFEQHDSSSNVAWYDGSHKGIAAATTGEQVLIWVLTSGGNGEIFRGSTSLGTSAYTATGMAATHAIGGSSGGAGQRTHGTIGRVLVSATAWNSTQRGIITSWASAYYGI